VKHCSCPRGYGPFDSERCLTEIGKVDFQWWRNSVWYCTGNAFVFDYVSTHVIESVSNSARRYLPVVMRITKPLSVVDSDLKIAPLLVCCHYVGQIILTLVHKYKRNGLCTFLKRVRVLMRSQLGSQSNDHTAKLMYFVTRNS
jgi:hypothetical protein